MHKDTINKDLQHYSAENTFIPLGETKPDKWEIQVLDIEGAVDGWISYDNEADYLKDLEILGVKKGS